MSHSQRQARLVKLVRKLLELARSNSNAHEAGLALARAQKPERPFTPRGSGGCEHWHWLSGRTQFMNIYLYLITMQTFVFWFLLLGMGHVPDPRTWFKDKGKNFISALPFLFVSMLFVSMVFLACLFAVFSRYFSEIGRLHYE